MTIVLLLGDRADNAIETYIKTYLSELYHITYVKHDSITEIGNGYGILVVDTDEIATLDVSECIVVLKSGCVPPKPKHLPKKSIIIANSQNSRQVQALSGQNLSTVICGSAEKDTLSYSSYTIDGLMVSLNRGITAFSGKKIEPLEFPLAVHTEQSNIYNLLAFSALQLILDNINSDIAFLY